MSGLLPAIAWRRSRLSFPADLDAKATSQALASATALGRDGVLILETTATPGHIAHHVVANDVQADVINQTLRTVVPGLRIETAELDRPDFSQGIEFKLSTYERPLRTDAPGSSSTALFSAVHDLKADETVRLQWTLRQARRVRPVQRVQQSKPAERSPLDYIVGPKNGPADRTKEATAKRAQPLVEAIGRLAVTAETRPRRRQLIQRCLGALGSNNRPGVGVRYRLLSSAEAAHRLNRRHLPWLHWPVLLNTDELSALIGWPVDVGVMPGLERGHARTLPVAGSIPSRGRVLADSNDTKSHREIALSAKDRLQHLHVVGPTGSGKSYLLANLALQDIAAGDGVIVIDPKGDLVEDILGRVELKDHDRIIVLDPTDESRPIGINLLDHNGETRELVVESIVGVFHELYRAFWGPRSDDILRASLGTLVAADEAYTICEVPALLTKPPFRRHVLKQLPERDPVLASFWAWFEGLSDGERSQAISPILNKLRAFTMRPRLRHVVGQTGGLQMNQVLARRQVLLVTLNSGLIGRDASQLLGSLIVAQLWQATLQRAAISQDRRRPAMVIIDEVQDFLRLPIDVGDMLAQARGLGVGLTLAHQHLGQLPSELKSAVLANARSRVVFRLGHDDARSLSPDFKPYLAATDLEGLQAYEVALRLSASGQIQPPTTGLTRNLVPAIPSQAQRLREASRERWGRDIEGIHAAMDRRQRTSKVTKVGREPSDGRAS